MTKILLVEDDKSLREIYGVRLLAEGYDIVSAGDGEEALAMAIKERPDLIVSDVMMPKISGFEMLDLLRSNESTKSIKVIMMTALSSENQRQRGEALGADRYLVKSQVGIEDVVRTVHEVLGDQNQAPAPATAAPMQSPINPPQATRPATFANPREMPQPVFAPQPAQQPQAIQQPEPVIPQQQMYAPPVAPPQQQPQMPQPYAAPPQPMGPPAETLPSPGFQSQQQPIGDSQNLTQSGSSMRSHKLEPTGQTLSPKIDLDALLANEEAKEIGSAPVPATSQQYSQLPQQPIQTAPPAPVQQVQIDPSGNFSPVAQQQPAQQPVATQQQPVNPMYQQPPQQQ